jgi:ABC-2 type transport system permease protein
MTVRRTAAVARRIIAQFRRDHRTLALVFIVPIAISLLLGWVIRDQAPVETRLVMANEAGAAGQRLVDAMQQAAPQVDPAFGLTVLPDAPDQAAAETMVEDGDADVALVVPADFAAGVSSGSRPQLIVVTPGSSPAEDGARMAAVAQLLGATALDALPPEAALFVPQLVQETIWLSPDADELDVLAPVFLGYFAYFFVFILTGISFLRERIGGTLERLLATPITRSEIVAGYGLGFGAFATLQVVVLTVFLLMAIEVPAIGPLPAFTIGLGVTSVGSPLLALVIALVLAYGAVNLGIFLSTFARTEFQVLQFIPLVIIPQGLLAGIFWPIDRLPDLLQPIARLLPLTYAVEGLRAVMLQGAGLASSVIQLDLAVLAGIALFFLVLAAATIRREVA